MAFRLPRCMRSYTADFPLTRAQETQNDTESTRSFNEQQESLDDPAVTVIELDAAKNVGAAGGDGGSAHKS